MNIKKMIPNNVRDLYINAKYKCFIKKSKLNILNDEETVNMIVEKNKSIVRFGDGEFKWILGIEQNSFQKYSKEMGKRLIEVLKNTEDNEILICIPEGLKDVSKYTEDSQLFWKNVVRWYGNKISKYLNKNYIYGNASFTRWYIEYKDKTNMEGKIKNLKRIWDKRELLIIEGADTKLGVGNDLLDNCSNIERIIAPSKNAYDKYKSILQLVVQKINKNKLIMIALGPTATILAYELAKRGYQALDIGHIDIEYEWYLKKATKKVLIPGKNVNEAGGMDKCVEINDSNYKNSIIYNLGDDN